MPIKPLRASGLTFHRYQRGVNQTDDQKKLLVSLLGLVGELGDVQTIFKRRLEIGLYPNFDLDMAEEIGDTLWYLTSLASRVGLRMEDIAAENISKAAQLHSLGDIYQFDKGYAKDEQLPRQFDVVFEEKPLRKSIQVKIVVRGVFVGDALTDNSIKDDGYRYHDAFHLAYAACLGWSPVTRSLLRRKRKSDRRIDEVEDGARATTVEEAISIFLFNQSQKRNEYRELNAIDISLLKTVRSLCGTLEVRRCTAKQWRAAIFSGYQIFRALRDNKGGIVSLDLNRASISYSPLRPRSVKGRNHAGRSGSRLPNRMARRRAKTSKRWRRSL
ncbi:MAG TPA: nucleotide pyrophosphohydrolase [Burkholderiales bacterium]